MDNNKLNKAVTITRIGLRGKHNFIVVFLKVKGKQTEKYPNAAPHNYGRKQAETDLRWDHSAREKKSIEPVASTCGCISL